MNNHNTPPQYNDEIDLKDLLKRIIAALERGTKVIIISVVVGGIIGIVYSNTVEATYKSSLTLSSNILALPNVQAFVSPLALLIKESDSREVAQRLGIEEKTARAVEALQVESIFEKETDNNEKEISYFKVTATITDNAVLPDLQEGIVHYFQNNEYVKKREAVKKQSLSVLIEKADNELKKLDSLQEKIEVSSNTNVLLVDNIYLQALEMAEKKQQYVEALALVESIQVMNGFMPFDKPTSLPWILCVVAGLAGGLIVGFAILIFMELDRYVRS